MDVAKKEKALQKHAKVMVVLLVIQYLLGMNINLFVQFPETGSEGVMWEFAKTQMSIILHMSVGLGLLIGTIALLVRAVKYKNKVWKISSVISTVAILGAYFSGISFIPAQNDVYSYTMAVGFIIAVLSYGWAFYASK